MNEPIRCPICVNEARELAVNAPPRSAWKTLAQADRLVARATFVDWTERAIHMVVEHGWAFHSGTLAERSSRP